MLDLFTVALALGVFAFMMWCLWVWSEDGRFW